MRRERPTVEFTHHELALMVALVNSMNPEEWDGEERAVIERCRALAARLGGDGAVSDDNG